MIFSLIWFISSVIGYFIARFGYKISNGKLIEDTPLIVILIVILIPFFNVFVLSLIVGLFYNDEFDKKLSDKIFFVKRKD